MNVDACPVVNWLWVKIIWSPQNGSANMKYDQSNGLFVSLILCHSYMGDFQLSLLRVKLAGMVTQALECEDVFVCRC